MTNDPAYEAGANIGFMVGYALGTLISVTLIFLALRFLYRKLFGKPRS